MRLAVSMQGAGIGWYETSCLPSQELVLVVSNVCATFVMAAVVTGAAYSQYAIVAQGSS